MSIIPPLPLLFNEASFVHHVTCVTEPVTWRSPAPARLSAQVTWEILKGREGHEFVKGVEWNLDAMLCAQFTCTSCYLPIY